MGWGEGGEEGELTVKRQHKDHCSDGTILYLDCGSGYINLYMW